MRLGYGRHFLLMKIYKTIVLIYVSCACVSSWAEPSAPAKNRPVAPHVIYTVEQLQQRAPATQRFWKVSQAEADKAWAAVREKIQKSKLPADSALRTKLDSYAIGFAGRIDEKTGKKMIAVTGATEYSKDNMPGLTRATLTNPTDPNLFALYNVEQDAVAEMYPDGELH